MYYVFIDQPAHDLASPDDFVRIVREPDGSRDFPVQIVSKGMKSWSGAGDQITVEDKRGGPYHVYVVLEYRGGRLMVEGVVGLGH